MFLKKIKKLISQVHIESRVLFFTLDMNLKLKFWTPGPNFWAPAYQIQPLAPIQQIKNHGERQRKDIYYITWDTLWE
jgi:hypothetical protein